MEAQGSERASKCCSASRKQGTNAFLAVDVVQPGFSVTESGMVHLPGGRFLMGTDYPRGFTGDGEGPVRPVRLSPFAIDVAPVTNDSFTEFVQETGYQTEAERFGWSFVFWNLIQEDRYKQLVSDTVAEAPWWCQ